MKSPSKNSVNKTLGHYLKERRVECGHTQEAVAKRLNYSTQFISNIELSKCPVPLDTLKKLISLYKMDSENIIELLLKEKKENLTQFFNA